jgi:hypothetical protein
MQMVSQQENNLDDLLANLRLENAEEVKMILEQYEVTSLSQLASLETIDLTVSGLSFDVASKLIAQATKMIHAPSSTKEFAYKDVGTWLRDHGLEQYLENFSQVPLKMLPFLRRSDLTYNLRLPLASVSIVWKALESIPKTLPPLLEPMDDSCELVCTTNRPPFRITINEDNYVKMLASASKQSNSIKVAFIGDTGAGKSLVISQLMKFEDRILNAKGPLIASPGQNEPTTGNVCYYQTEFQDFTTSFVSDPNDVINSKQSVIFLDFEGAYGDMPKVLKRRLTRVRSFASKLQEGILSGLNLKKETLVEMTKERENVVKVLFPQLAYLIANVVILLDKNPPHHTGYAEKLKRFTEASTRNPGTGEKPFLIVIQNQVDLSLVKNGEDSFNLEESNRDFHQCLQNQNVIDELQQYYREICFIRLPSWTQHPTLFDQQILLLQKQLMKYAKILMTNSWYARNFWSDHLWLKYVRNLCIAFKSKSLEDHIVNVSRIFSGLVQPEVSPFQRILHFWSFVWTPPTPGKQRAASRGQEQPLEREWNVCVDVTLERFAGIVLDTIQSKVNTVLTPDHLDKENIKETVKAAVEYFCNEISKYAPCLHRLKNGMVCGIAAAWHNTGHYGEKETGAHFGPIVSPGASLEELLKRRLMSLASLSPVKRRQKALELVCHEWKRKSAKQQQELEQHWSSCCMICLRKFAKDCKVTLLKCGHVICELCLDFTVKVDCPIHNNKPFEKIDFAAKIPKTAGVRILSLDGGSGVRGLIECKILGAIETITGYKIYQLFDLMVGSGVGGFVALSAALRKDDSRNIALFLAEYTQKRDSLILKRKLPFLKKYKFSSQPLKKQIQSVFGYVKLYDRYDVDPTTPLVAVASKRRGSSAPLPVFFTNYVHSGGLEDVKEIDGRQILHDCCVWEAAVATLSTPPFHRPLHIGSNQYFDGSFVVANPSLYALFETQQLWGSPIDCLISVGSGLSRAVDSKLEGDRILSCDGQIVDVVSAIENDAQQTALECDKRNIYYVRLNPQLSAGFPLDRISQKEVKNLFKVVNGYLSTNNNLMKRVCRHLVASLLYVATITAPKLEGDKWTLVIRSREKFTVSKLLASDCRLVLHCLEGTIQSSITYTANDNQNQNVTSTQYAVVELGNVSSPPVKIQICLVFDGVDECPISGGKFITLNVPQEGHATKLRSSNKQTPSLRQSLPHQEDQIPQTSTQEYKTVEQCTNSKTTAIPQAVASDSTRVDSSEVKTLLFHAPLENERRLSRLNESQPIATSQSPSLSPRRNSPPKLLPSTPKTPDILNSRDIPRQLRPQSYDLQVVVDVKQPQLETTPSPTTTPSTVDSSNSSRDSMSDEKIPNSSEDALKMQIDAIVSEFLRDVSPLLIPSVDTKENDGGNENK